MPRPGPAQPFFLISKPENIVLRMADLKLIQMNLADQPLVHKIIDPCNCPNKDVGRQRQPSLDNPTCMND